MPDPTGPILLVVGSDAKRLQWLTHHVTSHWPNAQVTTTQATDSAALARFVLERGPNIVILQVDFAGEASASAGLSYMQQMLRAQPSLHCIILAEHGSELAAVRSLKGGAKDYLPLGRITRDSLLKAVGEGCEGQGAASLAAEVMLAPANDAPTIHVPGYSIVKEIATSNFSSVFLARSERLRRNVVLKVMNRGETPRELDDAERFQREYEIISSIAHRSIAEIYDFGELPHHQYLAIEYIPCGDLRDRLRNPLSIDESLYYLRSIAEALRVIHVFGILHRDLKPANVMLREDNSPVLIDFGLARRSRDDVGTTGAGQVLGSPYYISPEQSQGHRVDARTDLYSLGVIFYEMLTGQRPYSGRSAMAIMAQHAGSPVPKLPPNVALQQALLDRLMAKELHQRYTSADELLADLGPLVAAASLEPTMFISVKRHEREKQELVDSSNRLTDALLKHLPDGVFLLDKHDRVLPQVSSSLAKLFRREDFSNLSFEKLLAPLVTAKTLTLVRSTIAELLSKPLRDWDEEKNPLQDVEVRLRNSDGSFDNARYSFDFRAVQHDEPAWLVRVVDITAQVQASRELEDLRAQSQLHVEVLRGVLQMGGARFGAFLQRTDASMKTINAVLKKSAREEDSFRHKLEETLEEVDRVRRDAAAFKLTGLESASRGFEDALHDLRSRTSLSGGDFLPLALKLDQLYWQFAAIRSLASNSSRDSLASPSAALTTDKGTQIIEAPKFNEHKHEAAKVPGAHRAAAAGSLENTLQALTDHVAAECDKSVVLDCTGLQHVPPTYQSAIKNIAIQLIRNAVMHGIESPELRRRAGKPDYGTLRLDFKVLDDHGCEFLFEDDGCGIDPETVRRTAVSRGIIAADAASRLRDREAIKLIFKSGYSTLPTESDDNAHGTGMSLVRRYAHEAGGKIALASLLGHETRFKITLPPPAEDIQAAS